MDRETEIALLDELLGLRRENSAYLDERVTHSPVDRYTDADRFNLEREKIFQQAPMIIAHASEIAGEGDFLCREMAGFPVLLTRDREGAVNAFYNVCRHRGATLVTKPAGCRHRFTCPYHAWTWDNQGHLIAVPHQEQGFPELDKDAYGLKPIACTERYGWIWIQFGSGKKEFGFDPFLSHLSDDLSWLQMDQLEVYATDERMWDTNWKVVVEGGLEAYHFRVAHARTIGSLFHDNLSTYQQFGAHIRSVLARRSVDDLVEMPRNQWRIREHANLLYTVFPNTAFLVQSDHVVWIVFAPEAPDKTRITCTTLKPRSDQPVSEKEENYWRKNHELTVATLNEDFELAEKIQRGFSLGVNQHLTFGRYEGALHRFNEQVDQLLK
ncbi:MAG: aromatic ring-hydroxylating dioxygenase subunit alpha [Rhizobiaceae bacterium]